MQIQRGILATAVALSLFSCTKETIETKKTSAPETYNFENASYSGQISRLNMLEELSATMKEANKGNHVESSVLKNMYANTNYTWKSAPFSAAQPTKQLKNKTFTNFQTQVESYMDLLDTISQGQVASSGVAGLSTSNDGNKKYVFDKNGFEPIQLIEKGIMGACFYFQGTSNYLSEEKLFSADNTENEEGKNYTKMQHYWDEAFGYTAIPATMTTENASELKSNGALRFYSKYLLKAEAGGLKTVNKIMKDGFIAGRVAIDNKNYNDRNKAITVIQKNWELINVASALHYLNGSIDKFADNTLRNHQLSEAYAFINALRYNSKKSISDQEIDAVLNKLGTNFYQITSNQIKDAKETLAAKFNVDSDNF